MIWVEPLRLEPQSNVLNSEGDFELLVHMRFDDGGLSSSFSFCEFKDSFAYALGDFGRSARSRLIEDCDIIRNTVLLSVLKPGDPPFHSCEIAPNCLGNLTLRITALP